MTKLLNFRTELQNHPSGNVFGPRLDKLVEVVRSYKIPVVTLSDLTIEEVCPIFERINSSGTRLSVYDLMVAATWSPSFDLNDTYTSITDFLDPKGFDEIEGDTVLKCLAAVHSRQVNRNDVLKLREVKPNMDDLARRTKDALSRAVDLLVSEFKVHSISYLPYEAILVILCAIVANHKTLDAAQIKRLRQWFWRSSLNERYRGAADSFITNDIKLVEDYVVFAKGNADLFGQAPNEATLCTVGFRIDSSRSKAFILAIASNNPRNITNSAVIDTYAALSGYNKKQYHHIYPRAYLKRNSSLGNYDALANICMLSASENIKISDSAPSDYLPHYYRAHGNRALEVFNSNFIPGASKVDYTNLTYTSFLNERAAMLRDALMILCEGEHL